MVPLTWLGFKAIQFTVGSLYLVCTFLFIVIAPSGAGIKPAGGGGIGAFNLLGGGGGHGGGGGRIGAGGGGGGITDGEGGGGKGRSLDRCGEDDEFVLSWRRSANPETK